MPSPTATGRTAHRLSHDGLVLDWLTGPLWEWPCDDLDTVVAASGSPWEKDAGDGALGRWRLTNGPDAAPIKAALYSRHPLLADQRMFEPRVGAPVTWRSHAETHDGVLSRAHTGQDGLVDWSGFARTPHYRLAVAATQLEVDQAEWRELELLSTGPIAVWIDGAPAARFDDVSYMEPVAHRLRVRLEAGTTTVVIASWQLALRECRHVVGLRVIGQPVAVVVTDPHADEFASAPEEALLDAIALDGAVSVDGSLTLLGAGAGALRVRVHDISVPGTGGGAASEVEAESVCRPDAGGTVVIELPTILAGSTPLPYEALVTVSEADSANGLTRTFSVLNASGVPTRRAPVGGGDEWRSEVLDYASTLPAGVAHALATADAGAIVTSADLEPALRLIADRGDCSDFEAVGILLLTKRVPCERWEAGAWDAARNALLGFKYWIDQPGIDAQCYFTENHQLMWHVAEHLAGVAFDDDEFANTGWKGREHAEHGRRMAREWLTRKLTGGFSEFESNAYVAINCFSLVALVEAADAELADLARRLLDLVLCSLATSSWQGIHATAHGRSYTRMLRSARLEETGPLMWLCWGAGSLNPAVAPAVAMATSTRYRVPGIVRDIGAGSSRDWSYTTVDDGHHRADVDLLDRPFRSTVTGRHTPYAAIACVEDYRVGLPGLQEHIWGVTLGTETQVFATHPATSSRSGDVRPNAWSGNRVLPRARCHRDTVIALHRIPIGDPLSRTHLWFPSSRFDEIVIEGEWLGGRLGKGLVAVATAGGFARSGRGEEAAEEWNPRGAGLWYVATIGSTEEHQGLSEFVCSLGAPEFAVDDRGEPSVRWARPGREIIEFDYSGRLTVDGRAAAGPPRTRFHSPAADATMDDDAIRFSLHGNAHSVRVR